MEKPKYRSALIVGTGPGLSTSLARLLARNGLAVSLAARQTDKLAALAKETGAEVHACNAIDQKEVAALFDALDAGNRTPDVVVYNASYRTRGPFVELDPAEVAKAIEYNERVQRADQAQGNQRWQAMGFVRQVMHRTGARKDQLLSYSESSEGQAVSELQKLDVRRAELAQQLPQAEKAEAAAFGEAKPAATAELTQRQDRAELAREILSEQRRQEIASRSIPRVLSLLLTTFIAEIGCQKLGQPVPDSNLVFES